MFFKFPFHNNRNIHCLALFVYFDPKYTLFVSLVENRFDDLDSRAGYLWTYGNQIKTPILSTTTLKCVHFKKVSVSS